jgi:hypothetical protein
MGKGIDFDMKGFPTDAEIERMFKAVPILERYASAVAGGESWR